MEIDDIRKLVELMAERGVVELEMEDRKGKIRLVRENHRVPAPMTVVSAPTQLPPLTQAVMPLTVPPVAVAAVQESKTEEFASMRGVTITSPMVGTFYRAPSPDANPYVEVGTIVEKGDVVCIIEAMKMMNEIQAEERGRVLRVLAENGQPIEYEQPLFLLEPL